MLGTLIVICITILLLSSIIGGVIIEKSKDKCRHLYDLPVLGLQRCKYCGVVHRVECNHLWECIDSTIVGSGTVNTIRCNNCEDIIIYKSSNTLNTNKDATF